MVLWDEIDNKSQFMQDILEEHSKKNMKALDKRKTQLLSELEKVNKTIECIRKTHEEERKSCPICQNADFEQMDGDIALSNSAFHRKYGIGTDWIMRHRKHREE